MDPERAAYLRTVEEAFVSIRGRGFMVSPKDVALIESWRTEGVSAAVVVRAIHEGAKRFVETHPPCDPMPATLAYYAPQVKDLTARRRRMLIREPAVEDNSAASEPAAPEQAGLDRVRSAIVEAGERQDSEEVREVLRVSYRALNGPIPPDLDSWTLTAQVDEQMVEGLEQVMALEDRDRLQEDAERSVPEGGLMSPRARADRVRVQFERQLRDHFSVPDLIEMLE
jgi:hypothetical protein